MHNSLNSYKNVLETFYHPLCECIFKDRQPAICPNCNQLDSIEKNDKELTLTLQQIKDICARLGGEYKPPVHELNDHLWRWEKEEDSGYYYEVIVVVWGNNVRACYVGVKINGDLCSTIFVSDKEELEKTLKRELKAVLGYELN